MQFVLPTTDSLGNDFASSERAVQSFAKALQQPSSSPPISLVPPAPCVPSYSQHIIRPQPETLKPLLCQACILCCKLTVLPPSRPLWLLQFWKVS